MSNSFDREFLRELAKNKEYRAEAEDLVRKEFENQKDILIQNFENHPVTQEIGNPDSENISKTLGGYGNLYGFLGLESDDPISPVKEVLENKVELKTIKFKQNQIITTGSVPDLNAFDSAAALEWDTKNWVKGIERGISGFQFFMAKLAGRSGRGIQTKTPAKPFAGGMNRFKNTKYMSELLNQFKSSLSKI